VIPDQDDLLDLLRARGEATSVSVRPDRLEFGDFEYRDAVERVGSRWVVSHSGRDGAFELVLSTPDVGYVQRRLADSAVVATRRTLGYPFPWLPVDASGVSPRFALDVDRSRPGPLCASAEAGPRRTRSRRRGRRGPRGATCSSSPDAATRRVNSGCPTASSER
jgi:hypothetical protein